MEYKINAKDLGISTKASVEVCRFLKNKSLKKAQDMLNRVIEKKQAVPYKRFNQDTPHKPGKIGAGKYPKKVSQTLLKLLNGGEKSAQNSGLSSDLIISHISAHKAGDQWHFGRKRRRKMKRTHINIILKENDRKTDNRQKN